MERGHQVGNYLVDSELGAGGMARVYRVRHATLGTLHALKVLEPRFRAMPEVRDRFLAEARIQATLVHESIVRVTDTVSSHEVAGFVMELIDGPTLEDHLAALRRPMTGDELRAVFLPILEALGEAHAKGIIHRDIKPANIMLAKVRGQLCPKLADFGIAKVTETLEGMAKKASTHADAKMGTVAYMSPEQIQQAKSVTARSDIFSLGATLYEAATGIPAFDGKSDFEIMRKIVDSKIVPPIQLVPDMDRSVAVCIARSLNADPAARFASCAEFADALRTVHPASIPPRPAVAPPRAAAQTRPRVLSDSGSMTAVMPRHEEPPAPQPRAAQIIGRPRQAQPKPFRWGLYTMILLLLAATAFLLTILLAGSDDDAQKPPRSSSAPPDPTSAPPPPDEPTSLPGTTPSGSESSCRPSAERVIVHYMPPTKVLPARDIMQMFPGVPPENVEVWAILRPPEKKGPYIAFELSKTSWPEWSSIAATATDQSDLCERIGNTLFDRGFGDPVRRNIRATRKYKFDTISHHSPSYPAKLVGSLADSNIDNLIAMYLAP